MKKLSKIFAILICLTLTLGVCVLPLSAENNAQLHDDMTDWSKVSAHSENWDMFASHAETGLSVIGRKNVTDESSVTYTAENDDTFKRAEISLQVYSGFVSVSRDLKAEYRTDEKSEWKSLVMTEEGEENIIGKETLAFKLQKIYCELPAETAEIKISLLNDVGWTLFIDSVTLDIKKGNSGEDKPDAPGEDILTDDFSDLSKPDFKTDNFDVFPNHPETGLSVIGRKTTDGESSVAYNAPEGKYFSAVKLGVQKAEGYVLYSRDIRLEYKISDTDEWVNAPLTEGETKDIKGAANPVFKTQELSAALPENTRFVKISLLNDVVWTLFLDELGITLKDVKVIDGGKTDDGGKKDEPEVKDTILTDEFEDFSKTETHTDNFEFHNPHPETGLSVMGRGNGNTESSVTYAAEKSAYITSAKIGIQFYTGFFDAARDIKVEVLVGKAWKTVNLLDGEISDINGSTNKNFKSTVLTVDLPANVKKVKISLLNDVAWTLFLDRAEFKMSRDGSSGIIYGDFTDELADFSKVYSHSDNMQAFAEHPETGLSVVGKTDGEDGYISYKVYDKEITSVKIRLVIADGYFDKAKHFSVQTKNAVSAAWKTIDYTLSAPTAIAGTEKFVLVTATVDKLPLGTDEIRLNLTNDVAWTLFADSVSYTTGKLTDISLIPKTDGAQHTQAACYTFFVSAAVLLFIGFRLSPYKRRAVQK